MRSAGITLGSPRRKGSGDLVAVGLPSPTPELLWCWAAGQEGSTEPLPTWGLPCHTLGRQSHGGCWGQSWGAGAQDLLRAATSPCCRCRCGAAACLLWLSQWLPCAGKEKTEVNKAERLVLPTPPRWALLSMPRQGHLLQIVSSRSPARFLLPAFVCQGEARRFFSFL